MRNIGARPLTIAAAATLGVLAMVAVGSGVSAAAPAHAPAVRSVAMAQAAKPNAVTPASRLPEHTTQNGVNIRACASTSGCSVIGTANSGDTINSWCFLTGQTVNGDQFWDLVWDQTANRGGFISESLLTSTSEGETC